MKDHLKPHRLFDRVVLAIIAKRMAGITDEEYAMNTKEIKETYLDLFYSNRTLADRYSNIFGLLTTLDLFRALAMEDWLKSAMVLTGQHWYVCRPVRFQYSGMLRGRYNQYPELQDRLDRMVEILSGKTLRTHHEELIEYNKLD